MDNCSGSLTIFLLGDNHLAPTKGGEMINTYNRSQLQILERNVRNQERRENRKKTLHRMLTGLGFLLLTGVLVYTSLSADCTTGGSCDNANGDIADWLFPYLQKLRDWLQ